MIKSVQIYSFESALEVHLRVGAALSDINSGKPPIMTLN